MISIAKRAQAAVAETTRRVLSPLLAETTRRVLSPLLCVALLAACDKPYEELKAQRARDVKKSPTVNVALVWDQHVKDFLLVEGVMQAADEINSRGGLNGKKLQIKVHYSRDDADEQRLAIRVAKDTTLAAVIGHRSSANAIPASITYEYHGLLFVSPSSTNNNLTNHGFQYTFRTLAADRKVGEKMAQFMRSQGLKKIAIVEDRIYGKSISDGVMESLADAGLKTVIRRSYGPEIKDFKPLCAELLTHDFDALFVGGILPKAAEFIREARRMGIRQRFYGGAPLDSRLLEKVAGKAADGTVVATQFNSQLTSPLTEEFLANFKKRYGKLPDTRAALGYDSMNILFEAMRRSGSADPLTVAANMRFIKNWQGVNGAYTYDLQGDLVDKAIYFKHLDGKKFVYFEEAQVQPFSAVQAADGEADRYPAAKSSSTELVVWDP